MEKFKALEVLGKQKVGEMIGLLELSKYPISGLNNLKENSLEFITLLSKELLLNLQGFFGLIHLLLGFHDLVHSFH